jgi:hypothetical protein
MRNVTPNTKRASPTKARTCSQPEMLAAVPIRRTLAAGSGI